MNGFFRPIIPRMTGSVVSAAQVSFPRHQSLSLLPSVSESDGLYQIFHLLPHFLPVSNGFDQDEKDAVNQL